MGGMENERELEELLDGEDAVEGEEEEESLAASLFEKVDPPQGFRVGDQDSSPPLLDSRRSRHKPASLRISFWNPLTAQEEYIGVLPPDATHQTLILMTKKAGKYYVQGQNQMGAVVGAKEVVTVAENAPLLLEVLRRDTPANKAPPVAGDANSVAMALNYVSTRDRDLTLREMQLQKLFAENQGLLAGKAHETFAGLLQQEKLSSSEALAQQMALAQETVKRNTEVAEKMLEAEKASMLQVAKVQEQASQAIITAMSTNHAMMLQFMQLQAAEREKRDAEDRRRLLEEAQRREDRENERRREEREREAERRREERERLETERRLMLEAMAREEARRQEHMQMMLTLVSKQQEAANPLTALAGVMGAVKAVSEATGLDLGELIKKGLGGESAGGGGGADWLGALTTLGPVVGGIIQEALKAYQTTRMPQISVNEESAEGEEEEEEEGEEESEEGQSRAIAQIPEMLDYSALSNKSKQPVPLEVSEGTSSQTTQQNLGQATRLTSKDRKDGRMGVRKIVDYLQKEENPQAWIQGLSALLTEHAALINATNAYLVAFGVEKAFRDAGASPELVTKFIQWVEQLRQQGLDPLPGIPLRKEG